jgi:hypothetical protein
MVGLGLVFRFESKWESEDEVATYMEETFPAAMDGLPTEWWRAVRFDTTTFGVIADFSDAAAEREHVGDLIAEALRDIEDLLEAPPTVASFDVLAPRIPA